MRQESDELPSTSSYLNGPLLAPPLPLFPAHPLPPRHSHTPEPLVPRKPPLSCVPRMQQHPVVQRPHPAHLRRRRVHPLPKRHPPHGAHPRAQSVPVPVRAVATPQRQVALAREPSALRSRQPRAALPGCARIWDPRGVLRHGGCVCGLEAVDQVVGVRDRRGQG
ncbi:hypothetical protein B0H15DRAFT_170402 [Mycena belliarum]|uniref:Uncharacterized protein n=1 Tax=Mycena belliarum TaxID=1033014 RepID=A0AAD6U909_9AGAR|nr:hypothetical protein B0H15DRAFT_170402 [Mycena belliae]